MSRKDPYSTPARRRRIIAEVTKKNLREYCINACANVAVVRKRTRSAIILQCVLRAYFARQLTSKLRYLKQYSASTKIQTLLRAKLACRRVKKLIAERHLRRQMRLAQVVNNLRNSRKNRMAWLAFLIAKKIAREKRQRKAAIDMQRVLRGHTARNIYRRMHQEHLAKIKQRNMAAVLIQSCMRRCLAIKSYLYWLTRRKAGWVIFKTVIAWWERRKRIRNRRARTIQRHWRGYLGRMYAAKQRSELERQREQVRLRESILLQTLLLEEVTSELIHHIAQSCLPEEHTMHIHVDVSAALVRRMVTAGPRYVVEWCLENSIVQYRHTSGYSAGAVVQQVVRSVDHALHAPVDSLMKPSIGNVQEPAGEKLVALSSWDEGTAGDKPLESILPTNWAEIAFATAPPSTSILTAEHARHIGVPNGAGLSVENVSTRSIHLHITTLHFDTQSQQHTRNIVTIVFNSPHDSSVNTDGIDGMDVEQATDLSEVKFRFKNVQVYLDNPAPAAPEVIAPAEADLPELEVFEDSGSDEEEELVVPVVHEVKARPTTAVVRIVLREPTPPPPPIDFDAKAVILQMFLRRKYLHKSRFARRIQRFTRRSKLIFAWQDAVYSVLEIAHDAATIMQCWLRRAAAQRLLQHLKDSYERAHFVYGHDFTLSEEANWAAFGLAISGADDYYCEELCRRPVVQLSTQHWNNTTRLANSLNKAQEEKLLQAARLPAAGEVLRLIEYPPPPPGCLPPPANTHEHGADHFSMFSMLDPPDHTGATKSVLDKNDASSGTAESMVDNHKHFPDSFLQQLVVRRFIDDTNTCKHTHLSRGDAISTEATLPGHNGLLEEAGLRKWRQEHLGDILDGSSADLSTLCNAADFLEENIGNNVCYDQQWKSVNHTAPIYALLARKF